MSGWTQQEAIELCKAVEAVCPPFGCHVALTGGCLYGGEGERKDCDILFYRIRQVCIEEDGLWSALTAIGLAPLDGTIVWGWCVKATYQGKPVDCFFPEELRGKQEYPIDDPIDDGCGIAIPANSI